MKKYIYADNAATTKLDMDAFEAMKPYLLSEYGNASQPYSFARPVRKALKAARETIAECIGALPDEIYFTSGGTESDNWAIKGSAFFDETKRAVITSQIEHHAVLNACASIERLGYPAAYLPVDSTGTVSTDSLSSFINDRTRLVSIMLSNNEIGSIQPIRELCSIAHNHGALFHTDAVQAIGHIEVDVNTLGIDMLSASAHKFNGPKGIGFLYIRSGTRIASLNDGGSQEFGRRAGTENIASIVGMSVALKKNCSELKKNHEQLMRQEQLLIDGLSGVHYHRNGSQNHVAGNLSLSFPGFNGEAILHRMDLLGISISTGSACDSVNAQISHVLSAIKLDEVSAEGTVRISLGKNNTDDDAVEISKALRRIVE